LLPWDRSELAEQGPGGREIGIAAGHLSQRRARLAHPPLADPRRAQEIPAAGLGGIEAEGILEGVRRPRIVAADEVELAEGELGRRVVGELGRAPDVFRPGLVESPAV